MTLLSSLSNMSAFIRLCIKEFSMKAAIADECQCVHYILVEKFKEILAIDLLNFETYQEEIVSTIISPFA